MYTLSYALASWLYYFEERVVAARTIRPRPKYEVVDIFACTALGNI